MNCEDCREQVELVVKGKRVLIDKCISPIIDALNKSDTIRTSSSCCGDGKSKASFIAMIGDAYLFFEIDLMTPLETWEKYRPLHEKMLQDNK